MRNSVLVTLLLLLIAGGCNDKATPTDGDSADSNPGVNADASGGNDQQAETPAKPAVDLFRVAFNAAKAGELDKAEESIRKRILEAPNDALSVELYGDIALRQNRAGFAAKMFEQAFEMQENPT